MTMARREPAEPPLGAPSATLTGSQRAVGARESRTPARLASPGREEGGEALACCGRDMIDEADRRSAAPPGGRSSRETADCNAGSTPSAVRARSSPRASARAGGGRMARRSRRPSIGVAVGVAGARSEERRSGLRRCAETRTQSFHPPILLSLPRRKRTSSTPASGSHARPAPLRSSDRLARSGRSRRGALDALRPMRGARASRWIGGLIRHGGRGKLPVEIT